MPIDQYHNQVVCLITAPQADAPSIASNVLERKLAACINIVPLVQSLYWWEGKIAHDDEALLIVKTIESAIAPIEQLLEVIHPYDTFELISFDITAGSSIHLQWITDSVKVGL